LNPPNLVERLDRDRRRAIELELLALKRREAALREELRWLQPGPVHVVPQVICHRRAR
jgi:hypothetical protein